MSVMKRSVKIILVIVSIVLVAGTYFGYQIYQMVLGSEPISGKQGNIPTAMQSIPPITTGIADWTNWRGDHFEGKSTSTGLVTDWSKGLQKLWQVNYICQDQGTASWSAPVVQGNRLIVPGRDEKNDLVFCINAESGELIWKGSYQSEAGNSHGPGSRATPFINDGRVYTFGRSGDLLWKSMEGEAGYASAIPMEIEDEVFLLIYQGTGLSCLNPEDGKVLWTAPWATEYGVNATTPIVSNELIFHTSGYKMGSEALRVTKSGYTVLWKNNLMEAQHSDPILIDGYIYGYSGESSRNNGQFKCIELSTGKEMWSTNLIGQGTTTYVDGHLVCQDIKGNVFLVKPTPSSFVKVGEIHTAIDDVKNPAWTVPVVANGKLYLRYMQQLVCYKLDI